MTHYIPYVNSPELLIKSYESARFYNDVIILDNRGVFSKQEDPRKFIRPLHRGHKIRKLDISLTTAQIMNYMLIDSFKRGDKFFTWQHGDVEYSPDVFLDFRWYVMNLVSTDWGIIYTHHDLLAAYNVEALMSINGWDALSFPYYFLDNDIAARLHKAGYKMVIYQTSSEITHHSSATINSDRYRKYVNDLIFPTSKHLNQLKHGDYQPVHIGANEYS